MEVAMSEWWRRFKEANATERAYVIVLAVFLFCLLRALFSLIMPCWPSSCRCFSSSLSSWSTAFERGRIDVKPKHPPGPGLAVGGPTSQGQQQDCEQRDQNRDHDASWRAAKGMCRRANAASRG